MELHEMNTSDNPKIKSVWGTAVIDNLSLIQQKVNHHCRTTLRCMPFWLGRPVIKAPKRFGIVMSDDPYIMTQNTFKHGDRRYSVLTVITHVDGEEVCQDEFNYLCESDKADKTISQVLGGDK